MAKLSGLGFSTLNVADAGGTVNNIRTSITNFDLSMPRATQDITSIDTFAYERLLLLSDLSINLTGNFDDAPASAGIAGMHWTFHTLNAGTNRFTAFAVAGSTLGSLSVLYTDYTVKRDNNGALTATATGSLSQTSAPTWT